MSAEGARLDECQRAQVVARLREFDPAVIYLFGSYGTAGEHPGSDLDLAVLPRLPLSQLACFAAANDLSNRLGIEVDLVDLTGATTVMAKEVMRTGTPIMVADAHARQIFEMQTLADYARLNEERSPILALAP